MTETELSTTLAAILDELRLLRAEVTALHGATPATEPPLVDAAEISRHFGVSRSWAYENAERLGAIRIGDGPKSRLRFDPERVAAILGAGRKPQARAPEPPPARIRRRATRSAAGTILAIRPRGGE